jgi:hypothetical protein
MWVSDRHRLIYKEQWMAGQFASLAVLFFLSWPFPVFSERTPPHYFLFTATGHGLTATIQLRHSPCGERSEEMGWCLTQVHHKKGELGRVPPHSCSCLGWTGKSTSLVKSRKEDVFVVRKEDLYLAYFLSSAHGQPPQAVRVNLSPF